MDEQDIQDFADSHKLDVKQIEFYHFRLLNEYGKFILDIYIKRKNGRIIRNTVLQWRTNKWLVAHNKKDLEKLL